MQIDGYVPNKTPCPDCGSLEVYVALIPDDDTGVHGYVHCPSCNYQSTPLTVAYLEGNPESLAEATQQVLEKVMENWHNQVGNRSYEPQFSLN